MPLPLHLYLLYLVLYPLIFSLVCNLIVGFVCFELLDTVAYFLAPSEPSPSEPAIDPLVETLRSVVADLEASNNPHSSIELIITFEETMHNDCNLIMHINKTQDGHVYELEHLDSFANETRAKDIKIPMSRELCMYYLAFCANYTVLENSYNPLNDILYVDFHAPDDVHYAYNLVMRIVGQTGLRAYEEGNITLEATGRQVLVIENEEQLDHFFGPYTAYNSS